MNYIIKNTIYEDVMEVKLSNFEEIKEWLHKNDIEFTIYYDYIEISYETKFSRARIQRAFIGDYIVKNYDGNMFVFDGGLFGEIFEETEE